MTGIVTLDGNLLESGSVRFLAGSNNNSKAAEGSIQSDGTYAVQIGQSGKLYVGEYKVEVASRGPIVPHPEGGPPMPGELITPEHYRDLATSGLCYNIRTGENTIDIALISDPVETPAEEALDSEVPSGDGSAEKSTGSSTEEPAEILQEAAAEEASAE